MKNLLLVIVSSGHMVPVHDMSFPVAPLALPFEEIDLPQELLLMKLQLPHGSSQLETPTAQNQ